MATLITSTARQAAFGGIVDYAGLYPPTSGSMADTLHRFASYRRSPERWMLGRLVVGTVHLETLGAAAPAMMDMATTSAPWPLTVVWGGDPSASRDQLTAFGQSPAANAFTVEAIECKASSPADVSRIVRDAPDHVDCYVEVPIAGRYAPWMDAIGGTGARAKLRTGGVTPDAFPAPDAVLDFIAAARHAGVAWKATAGLHHPLRGDFPLTYAPAAPRHTMYGFVNVLLAAARIHRDDGPGAARETLLDGDRGHLRVTPDAIVWRGTRFAAAELAAVRRLAFTSFGSCSFREPADELAALPA